MGGSSEPPLRLESLSDWRAASNIWSNIVYESDALAQFSNSNHMGPVRWHHDGEIYHGSFSWCPGQEVVWNYNSDTHTLAVDSRSQQCNLGEPNRIPDATAYEFLCYVLAREPSELVDELCGAQIHDFRISAEESTYSVVFTYDSSVAYTTATATHTESGFGPILVS